MYELRSPSDQINDNKIKMYKCIFSETSTGPNHLKQCLKQILKTSAKSRSTIKTVRLMYLPEAVPADIHKLIPKEIKKVQKAEHPLLMETLEIMSGCEKDFFNLDKLFSCVLAYLCAESLNVVEEERRLKVQKILEDVLEKEKDNIIALCVKRKLNRVSCRSTKQLKTLMEDEIHRNHAFAVIAFYLYELDMIHAAIALFEQAIKVWEQNGKGQELKVILWKYLLASANIELLNEDMFTKKVGFDPEKTMACIKDLLSSGMDFGKDHTVLAARCYSDLALAFSKYRLIGRPEDRKINIDLTPKECYEEAWKLCDGNDPHVMEKYAMFMRKTATNTESLLNAAKIFEKLLGKCPHRHVAAHQLALTYKYLWFEEEKLEQRYLYQNQVKTGNVLRAQDLDKLRAGNPISKKPNADYLRLANDYLEKANKSAKHSRALYLVDHARVKISLGDSDSAESYFASAKTVLSARGRLARHKEIAYLYEQWALMLADHYCDGSDSVCSSDCLTDTDGSDIQTNRLDCIENYFLKSIQSSIQIKADSNVAYSRLTKMLENPAASHKWKSLYQVYQLFGQTEKAANLLKVKDKQEPEVRKLFKQECRQTEDYDKFLDLAHSILSKSPAVNHSLERDIVEMTLLKNRSLLDSACCEETVCMKMYADYGETVKLSLMQPISHDSGDAGAGGIQPQRKRCEIQPDDKVLVFMARNDYTDAGVFAYIHSRLKKMVGVVVKQDFTNQGGDLEFGCSRESQIIDLVKQSRLILVSDYKCKELTSKNSQHFQDIVSYAKQIQRQVFIMQETDEPLPDAWTILPCMDVRNVDNDANFHDFLVEVCRKFLGADLSHCKKQQECQK